MPTPSAARRSRVGDVTRPRAARRAGRARFRRAGHPALRRAHPGSASRWRGPTLYYQTNVGGMMRVVGRHGAEARASPSSSRRRRRCTGSRSTRRSRPTHACRPENPYGWSRKWMGERILADCARAGGFGYAILRYFNACPAPTSRAGCGRAPRARDAPRPAGHRRRSSAWRCATTALRRRLADARRHLRARLRARRRSRRRARARARGHRGADPRRCALNLGGGEGTSVKDVLTAVERVVGRPVPFEVAPRRAGDVAQLVADIGGRASRSLDWTPTRSSIPRACVADAAAPALSYQGSRRP